MSDSDSEARGRGEPKHPIRVAARKAGLNPETIRAWERRHGAVAPARTATDRRLYSDSDIERLRLIGELSERGYGVGEVAGLPTNELRALRGGLHATGGNDALEQSVLASIGDSCRDAVTAMDAPRLQTTLMHAMAGLEGRTFLEDLVAPLLRETGERWSRGDLTVAHEHAASAAVRQSLGWMLSVARLSRPSVLTTPGIVIGTLTGEGHELGGLMAAVIAATAGWRVTYLGSNCPASDIAAAVTATNASAVALGITTGAVRTTMVRELHLLREALASDMKLLVGGEGAMLLSDPLLMSLDVERLSSLGGFARWLEEWQSPATAA